MRINWNFLKGVLLLGLVVFLYAFSSHKNNSRPVTKVAVQFIGNENVYITTDMVNKLLIQNQEQLYKLPKDNLDLKEMEILLESNDMIKSAQVYLTVNGEVRTKIEQKQPIARVYSDTIFYIDEEGLWMPLSPQHSARVPLVTGVVDKEDLEAVYTMALKVYTDPLLKAYITAIHQNENKEISLKMRLLEFEVIVGTLENLDEKMNNLKAFYQKAKKDNVLDIYKSVNLQFDSQVVCTKK
jgi:cell division protein FtsQ